MKQNIFRLFAVLLGCILLLSMAACTPVSNQEPTPTPPAPTPVTTPTATEPPKVADGPADFDEAATEALNGMHAVYDSYARAFISLPEDMRYADASDPVFFWTVLGYMCTNYAEMHPLCESTDTQYILPATAVREFADACFFGLEEIPELPKQLFDIVYDSEADLYFIGMSDAGDTYAQKLAYRTNAQGNITASIAWMGIGDLDFAQMYTAFLFELVPNENAGQAEPLFQYSVKRVQEGYSDLALVKAIYEKDGKQYATLDLAEVMYEPDNSLSSGGVLTIPENSGVSGGTDMPSGTPDTRALINTVQEDVDVCISELAEFKFNGFDGLFPDADMADIESDSRAFFIANAARESDGQHMYFYVNIFEGRLHGGAFIRL